MPKPNALVAHVKKINVPPETPPGTAEAAAGPQRTTISFAGDRTAILPPGKRAAVWRDMLDFTRQSNLPAYVEIDPETSVITRVLIPMRVRVVALEPAPDGNVALRFVESHAGHQLLQTNPDFQEMLNKLEGARVAGTEVLVTSTRDEHEIIDVRVPGPGSAPVDSYEDPPPSVVSEAQAAQLFNDMAVTTCDPTNIVAPCIPFVYPDDGCYARAHEMLRLMRLQGIEGEKIWIFASSNSNLKPATVNHPDCSVSWWYHVAPTLQVNTAAGVEKRVIDPSLMTGPATSDAWRTRQNDPAATFQFTDARPFWPNGLGNDDDYSLTNQYLQEKRIYLQDRVNEVGPPPYACPIVKHLEFILDRSTFGQDEAAALLQNANPAVIESALYITLDGFTPQEVGITQSTPTDPPTLKPTLNINPAVAQMEIRAVHLDMEDPAHLIRRQRITWTYDVRFTGTNGFNFASATQTVALSASFSGQSANASLLLIKQPNPWESDGQTHWLSTDLRVFQINAGQPKFGATMGASGAQAPTFIQQVINNLNTGNTGGQTFDNDLSTDQQASLLELSSAVNGVNVFNFAVARVHYIGTLQAQNVRVFFRMFPASTTSLAYDTTTTYRRGGQGGVAIPLLGVNNGQLVTIPCFASPRVDSTTDSLNTQADPPNVQTIPISGTERKVYYGAWLDFNQTTPQFQLNPSPTDGPWGANRKSIYELVRGKHQCLVAEIAFDPAPIPGNVTPGTSDKLAQRNLAIVESANPGIVASRRIPSTFEIRPTPAQLPAGAPHDELMIDWGRTPLGSVATIYLPGADAEEILDLSAEMYRTSNLVLIDEHTLQTRTGGMSWIPIPKGSGANFTGLITIDLPPTVFERQAFTVVVRQVTGFSFRNNDVAFAAPAPRHIVGSFQITIPVRRKEVLLAPEQRLLSNLRWIQRAIPETDRWYLVFSRYVSQIAARVDGFGGDSSIIAPSPSGDWQQLAPTSAVCQAFGLIAAGLLAVLIGLGAIGGAMQIVLGLFVLALLLTVGYVWIVNCRPSGKRLLLTALLGVVVGVVLFFLLSAVGP